MIYCYYSIPFDCKPVKIIKILIYGDEYLYDHRKKYARINVQATVNADARFTSITARWPGSVHDARIQRGSYKQFLITIMILACLEI